MIWLIIIALITVVLSWYFVKRLVPILSAKQIVDRPNERSLHVNEVPRGGGLAIVTLLMLAVFVIAVLSGRNAMFFGIFLSLLAWSGLSWKDDRVDLSPRIRFILQCCFAALSIAAFGAVQEIQLGADRYLMLHLFGVGISFIGIIWFVNLYNFMDGMDGLAASQTIIASATLCFWFWQFGDQSLAIICLVLAAASYGFLLWNWHPAKIFMGDVGSITIGAFFATLILIACSRYQMPVLSFVILFGVFVMDASITIVRRIYQGQKIWLPHRSHYYQRLAGMGFSHGKIVIGLIILMSISSFIASITLVDRDVILFGALLELVILLIFILAVECIESWQKRTNKL